METLFAVPSAGFQTMGYLTPGSGYPPNALTNNRIFNLTWTQSAVEPMRRTAKCALHAQLVCQRRATQSRSFQSDFVFCMQLAMGRTTLLMPISRRSRLLIWDAYPCNLEDYGPWHCLGLLCEKHHRLWACLQCS